MPTEATPAFEVGGAPTKQFLSPEYVLHEIGHLNAHRVWSLSVPKIIVRAVMAGAFITLGALFAVLLSTGVTAPGPMRLMEGLGFSAGYFFVFLSHSLLFTEANVVMPTAFIVSQDKRRIYWRVLVFWTLAFAGNFLGCFVMGLAVHASQFYPEDVYSTLQEIVGLKMQYMAVGGVGSWFRIVLSGLFANWLIGMAALFAVMGRTIIGMFVPVWLAVTAFTAANFQHCPANMGFFGLAMPMGVGPGWGHAIVWNMIPAAIGNIIGGTFLVTLPLWYSLAVHPDQVNMETII